MGRRKKNFDKMSAGFPEGTFERWDDLLDVLEDGKTRKDFLREAAAFYELHLRKKKRRLAREKSDKG